MPVIQTPEGEIHLPYGEEGAPAGPGPFMGGPPGMGGLPPEMLMQLMGGAGAGGAPPPEEPQSGGQSASDILRSILSLAGDYGAQEQSEQNLLLVEKLRTIAQQILANEEKEDEGLMQGKFSPSALRRLAPGG